MKIVLNEGQKEAVKNISSGINVCLLGMAGTGKTETIKAACNELEKQGKKIKKVSFQGIAAQLVGGCTIHRAFKFPYDYTTVEPSEKNLERLQDIDVLIIDEIGMVSADLFDKIGDCLTYMDRGIQIVVVGDFYQIEPILGKKKYAFQSYYWEKFNFSVSILTEVVRQGDSKFIANLAKLSRGEREPLKYFSVNSNKVFIDDAICICTHNVDVKKINDKKFAELQGEMSEIFCASYEGKIDEESLPGEARFRVKIGMRVIATVNTDEYANGEMGTVVAFKNGESITVKFDRDGKERIISWYELTMDRLDSEEYDSTKVQVIPLRAAYAISIHKSQGQTFEKVNIIINERGAWAHGQLYVALSRGRTIENIHIEGNIYNCNIEPNSSVVEFYKRYVS